MSARERKMLILSRSTSLSNAQSNISDSDAVDKKVEESVDRSLMSVAMSSSQSNLMHKESTKQDSTSSLAKGYGSSSVSGTQFETMDDRNKITLSNRNLKDDLGDTDGTKYLSPHPTITAKKIATPSSLFGEIMKRTQAEIVTDLNTSEEHHRSDNIRDMPVLGDASSTHCTFSASKPSTNHDHIGEGLISSNLPKRRNLFKQYSKRSGTDTSFFSSPKKRRSTSQASNQPLQHDVTDTHNFSSPQKTIRSDHENSSRKNYSSPCKLKTGVVWDPCTPISNKKSSLRRSPSNTPENQSDHKTPPRKRNINWDPRTPDVPKASFSTPNRYVNSPGGFALMNMINSCMSPQVFNHKRFSATNDEEQNSRSSTGSMSAVLDNWNETWMKVPRYLNSNIEMRSLDDVALPGEVGLIDWSIKDMVRIEYCPSSCIPGKPFQMPNKRQELSFRALRSQMRVDELAFQLFFNPNKTSAVFDDSTTTFSKEEIFCASWKAACMYWQYPASYPLQNSIVHSSNTSSNSGNLRRTHSLEFSRSSNSNLGNIEFSKKLNGKSHHTSTGSFTHSHYSSHYTPMNLNKKKLFCDYVKGSKAPLRQIVEKVDQISDASVFSAKRQNEWQECFKAISSRWMAHIQEANEDAALLDLTREYFYALLPNETFLFRVIRETRAGKVTHVPMIVLSSTTKETRFFLKKMGITIKLWHSNGDSFGEYKTVEENFVTNSSEDDTTDYQSDDNAMKLREELEDLRKAAHESVGAEVSILTSKAFRDSGEKNTTKKVQTFVILDHDDCSAFCEIFLNMHGLPHFCQDSDQNSHQIDVPLLLCRYLGPNPYMKLSHLSSSQNE